jgi:predicted Fe-Mo cluster-binding NifX family protein
MYLAMTMDGKTLESNVSSQFETCSYLLVVDTKNLSVNVIENKGDLSEENLAKKVIAFDCEGIITGAFNAPAFNLLADAYITRYAGAGYSGLEALDLMEQRKLELIKTIDGSDGCGGDHHQL